MPLRPRPLAYGFRRIEPVVLVFCPLVVFIFYVFWKSSAEKNRSHNKDAAFAMQLTEIPTNNVFHGIRLRGEDAFRLQVARALSLLKFCDEESFTQVTNNIGVIQQDEKSGVWYAKVPPVLSLSSTSAFYSITWCASILAHEAHHVIMQRQYSRAVKAIPEKGTYNEIQQGETACFAAQARVLEKVGAPRYELDYLNSLKGTHFDVNGDGRFDWEDIRLQHW